MTNRNKTVFDWCWCTWYKTWKESWENGLLSLLVLESLSNGIFLYVFSYLICKWWHAVYILHFAFSVIFIVKYNTYRKWKKLNCTAERVQRCIDESPPRSRRTVPAPESHPHPQAPSFLPRDRHCPDLCGTCFLLPLLNTLFLFCLFLNLIEMESYIVCSFTFGGLHVILRMLFIILMLKTSETEGKLLSFLYHERKHIAMSGAVVWTALYGRVQSLTFVPASCLSLILSHPLSR